MSTKEKWRGLKDLALDAVENGSLAVERVHTATAKRTFDALEQIPELAAPAKGIHALHDVAVSSIYGMIRLVNQIVGDTVDAALGSAEQPNLSSPKTRSQRAVQAPAPEPETMKRRNTGSISRQA
jgi:hypothetical protein